MSSTERPAAVRPRLITVEQARAAVLRIAGTLSPRPVPLREAAGLRLEEPVLAPIALPRFDNSAMDGYAVRARDAAAGARLRVTGTSVAGRAAGVAVGPGEAVAITTGAPIPPGADAVVRHEEARREGEDVVVLEAATAGRHVRIRGEDVRRGETVIERSVVLGPTQLAAAAALGLTEVVVQPRPRVAVLPTGDELRLPGSDLSDGQIYEALSIPLSILVEEIGAIALPRPIAPDEPQALMVALRDAAAEADAIVTVGGASLGERDVLRRISGQRSTATADLQLEAFEVALRPARPFVCGRAFGATLFGLPGNPASALAAFEELVRPALQAMMGLPPLVRPSVRVTLAEPVRQRPGRLNLLRVLVRREGGRLVACLAGDQGSGMIHTLARMNAWAVVPAEVEQLPAGAEVEVRLLGEVP